MSVVLELCLLLLVKRAVTSQIRELTKPLLIFVRELDSQD